MARGIDTTAHFGALKAGGRSVGVLGCGIDVVYPSENRPLFAEMENHGALISEFPMGTGPLASNFPRRNRIISGISLGVLVVEATERSGSLITARFALEQGREVFAIPGAITSGASRGTNQLIKQGAKLVETVADILEEFPNGGTSSRMPIQPALLLDTTESRVCCLLAEGPLQIDEIAGKAGLTVQELSVMLLRLELRGILLQLPGKIFILA
jgi:DNA processing protein